MRHLVRYLLGVFQLVGGAIGIAMVAVSSVGMHPLDWATAGFAGLYLLSCAAGISLLVKHRIGWTLTALVQLLQLPRLAVGHMVYHFSAGVGAWLMIQPDGVGIMQSVGSSYAFDQAVAASGSAGGGFTDMLPFGVNLIAATAIALMISVRKKFK